MATDELSYRAAEETLWASFGVEPSEQWVRLQTGEHVRVQVAGDGPPVLFVHGGSSSGANWAPLVARLGDFRCLVVDRPGCGLSGPLAGGRKLSSIAEFEAFADGFVADLLDQLGIDRAHLVPTSMGGYFALRGAAAHPERVDRIAGIAWLMGAVGTLPMSMRIAALPGLGQLMVRLPPTRFAVVRILRQLGLGPALDDGTIGEEFVDWFVALLRFTDTMRNELRAMPSSFMPMRDMNEHLVIPPEVLDRIEVPMLLVWSADDPIGGADVARAFAASLPDATLDLLPHGGHAPWVAEPERCATAVRAFLR